jgi:hypothetical protein
LAALLFLLFFHSQKHSSSDSYFYCDDGCYN